MCWKLGQLPGLGAKLGRWARVPQELGEFGQTRSDPDLSLAPLESGLARTDFKSPEPVAGPAKWSWGRAPGFPGGGAVLAPEALDPRKSRPPASGGPTGPTGPYRPLLKCG